MFKKNEAGIWQCMNCGKLASEHTEEAIQRCSAEETRDQNGKLISRNVDSIGTVYNPASKRK